MSSNYPHLTWRKDALGVWTREMDEIEIFYSTVAKQYSGSNRSLFAITCSFAVDTALGSAWVKMRHDHPTIAATTSLDPKTQKWEKMYREIRNKDDMNRWRDYTFNLMPSWKSGVEFASSNPPTVSRPTLFVFRPESADKHIVRRELVLRAPHDIADGGVYLMLHNLITHAAKAYAQGESYIRPVFNGSEATNLSPSYRIAGNVPPQLNQAQEQRLKDIAKLKADMLSSTGLLSLPYKHGQLVPGRHRAAFLTFSEAETRQILVVCKNLEGHVTPTYVFHAAVVLAMRDMQPREPQSKTLRYACGIIRSERERSCIVPYNTAKHPVALYHSASGEMLTIPLTVPAEGEKQTPDARQEEFLSTVSQVRGFYDQFLADKEHYALIPHLYAMATPKLPAKSESGVIPILPPKQCPTVTLSSLGRLDAYLSVKTGAFEVIDAWGTGEELRNGLGAFLVTFRGRMRLIVACNEAWHTEDGVQDFMHRCKDIVFKGLGIGDDKVEVSAREV